MNMQWIREQSSSLLIVLLFGIIILVFAFEFGPGSRGFRGNIASGYAAKVNGQIVTTGEWSFYYNQLFSTYQNFDPNFNNEKAEQYNLKQKALDQAVTRLLLAQAGDKLGLEVSNSEVAKDILKSSAFREEGRFDKEIYRKTVQYYFKMSVPRYEEKHRQDMMGERVKALLLDGPVVAETNAFEDWKLDNEKIDLDFVKFSSKTEADKITVPDEEAKAYAEKEKEKINTYFEAHKEDYEKPEQVHAEHILLKVDEKAGKLEQREVAKKAQEIAQKAKADPAKFEELAKQYGQDATKEKGGDLGFFARGRMVKEFEDAAFAMEPGQVSDPVKSRFGWHIIKVLEKKPGEKKTVEQVSLEIAKKILAEQRGKEIAKKQAEEFLAEVKAGKTFEELLPKAPEKEAKSSDEERKAEQQGGLKLQQTGPFARTTGAYIPNLGSSAELFKVAWELKPDKPVAEQVFEAGPDFAVVRLKDHHIPTQDEFIAAKKTTMEQDQSTLGSQAFSAWLKADRAESKIVVPEGVKLFQEQEGEQF